MPGCGRFAGVCSEFGLRFVGYVPSVRCYNSRSFLEATVTTHRLIARSILGLAVGLALTVTAGPPTAAAAASASPATWQLIDLHQRFCTPTDLGRIIYFFVFIEGTWSQELRIRLADTPPGFEPASGPNLPPGHSDGHGAVGGASAWMPPIPEKSEYVLTVRVTSGSQTQEVPVHLGVDDDWLDCTNNGPRAATLISPDAAPAGR
jgi:hypothetical protein